MPWFITVSSSSTLNYEYSFNMGIAKLETQTQHALFWYLGLFLEAFILTLPRFL